MVLNAIIQNGTNMVLLLIESENPINTSEPDYVIDVTGLEVSEGMIYNAETQTFSLAN